MKVNLPAVEFTGIRFFRMPESALAAVLVLTGVLVLLGVLIAVLVGILVLIGILILILIIHGDILRFLSYGLLPLYQFALILRIYPSV